MIKKRYLIIGSNGMLGQRLIKYLANHKNIELLLASVEPDSFFDEFNYKQLDISNKKEVKEISMNFYPDVVINAAAFTNVDKCETEKDLVWNINVKGVEYLAKYAVPADSHLIHISTDYVFDGTNGPYTEDELPNPISYYGRSKLASENVIRRFNISYTIIRTNVLFGPAKFGRPDFVKWVVNSLDQKKNIKIVTDQINNPTYIDDLVSAIIKITDLKKTGLYNIGGSEFLSRYEFTKKIAEYFDLNFELVEPILTESLNQPAPRPLKSGLVISKAMKEFNYKPHSLKECFNLMDNELNLKNL